MNKRELLLIGSVVGWVGLCWLGVCAFMMGWGLEDLTGSPHETPPRQERNLAGSAQDKTAKPDAIALVLRNGLDP